MAKRYDENVDYMDLINKATAAGDTASAAQYEQLRNEKIADMNITEYKPTNDYSGGASSYSYESPEEMARKEFEKNQNEWHTATDERKEWLHNQNEKIGDSFGWTYDEASGAWDTSTGSGWGGSGGGNGGGGNKPTVPGYDSKYNAQLDELLNSILSKKDFKYNAAEDPLYAQYAEQYQREGKRAMVDTVGEVSANTGGLASSYAATAGSQAQNYFAAKQADKIPELQQLAYSMYLEDIDKKARDLGLLQNADNLQYGRYRDTIDDNYRNADLDYRKQQDFYTKQMQQAGLLSQYGDFSGYEGLGWNSSQMQGAGASWLEDFRKQQQEQDLLLKSLGYDTSMKEHELSQMKRGYSSAGRSKSAGGGGGSSGGGGVGKPSYPQILNAVLNSDDPEAVLQEYGEKYAMSRTDYTAIEAKIQESKPSFDEDMQAIRDGKISYLDIRDGAQNGTNYADAWRQQYGEVKYRQLLQAAYRQYKGKGR